MVTWTHVMTSFFPSVYGNAGQLLFVFFHIYFPVAAFNLQNSTEPHQKQSQIITTIILIISHHLRCVQICFRKIITMMRWCFCLSAFELCTCLVQEVNKRSFVSSGNATKLLTTLGFVYALSCVQTLHEGKLRNVQNLTYSHRKKNTHSFWNYILWIQHVTYFVLKLNRSPVCWLM